MRAHSDQSLASILLTSHVIKRDEDPLTAREYWELIEQNPDPSALLGVAAREVASRSGVRVHDAERIAALLEGGTALAFELEKLEQSGIKALTPFDKEYPSRLTERLGRAAPPLLHAVGDLSLMATDGVGIVGSRNVAREGQEACRTIAREAVSEGLSVISGVARGVDQIAMGAALEAEGTVVGIPADSLAKVLRTPDVRRAISEGKLCLATPYAPTTGFSVGGAMGRNKIIYALSRVTVVIAADHNKGGTWAGAVEAMEKGYGTVAVWVGEGGGDGNGALVSRGGIAVENAADAVRAAPEAKETDPENSVEQLKLGL